MTAAALCTGPTATAISRVWSEGVLAFVASGERGRAAISSLLRLNQVTVFVVVSCAARDACLCMRCLMAHAALSLSLCRQLRISWGCPHGVASPQLPSCHAGYCLWQGHASYARGDVLAATSWYSSAGSLGAASLVSALLSLYDIAGAVAVAVVLAETVLTGTWRPRSVQ